MKYLNLWRFRKFFKQLDTKMKVESEKAFSENDFEKINELRNYAKNKIFNFINKLKNEDDDEKELTRLKLQRMVDMHFQSYQCINQIRINQEKDIEKEIEIRYPHDKENAKKTKIEMLQILETECKKMIR